MEGCQWRYLLGYLVMDQFETKLIAKNTILYTKSKLSSQNIWNR